MSRKNTKLATYRKKREFSKTPEPRGTIKKSKLPIFVIQEHHASHLHFDFRIEVDGVLKSWAIPKGISTKTGEKHLAVPTEDHPMEYAHFEGVIPKGHYGGGTVMVWDIGTYENVKEKNGKIMPMDQCVKNGRIEIVLNGKKLHGGYALVRTARKETGERYWLLLKMNDKYAGKAIKAPTKSALTGRTVKQIAASGEEYEG
jgi:DNA ligase D-like protein (predicted 3'-phosphoesterase)